MTSTVVGYKRVSSIDQNPERQLGELELDRIFIDYSSGSTIKRPQLQEMLAYLRKGDTVVVHSMDRLARNLTDLRKLVNKLIQKGIAIQFLKENLTFNGNSSPMSDLLLSVMGAFAEFERSLIRERQAEGIAIAKSKGKFKGRKKSLNPDKVKELNKLLSDGIKKSELAKMFDISRTTIYKYLRNN